MTVYCLIPVHDRLPETQGVLRCLRAQDFKDVYVVVIDDGSTDGTAEYLRRHTPDVELIVGDGYLWWGGAMAKGLGAILPRTNRGDFILFLNNDTRFAPDYISTLVAVSRAHGGAVVGSILMDVSRHQRIMSIGPRIRYGLARIEEIYRPGFGFAGDAGNSPGTLPSVVEVDALSGRGTLYPVEVLRKIGTVRHRWLPHYQADYEISVRAKAAGYKTLVSTRAMVWTAAEDSGIHPANATVLERLFLRTSRSNILDTMAFFTLCGPWYYRMTGPVRVLLFRLWGVLRCWLWRHKEGSPSAG